MMMKGMSTTVTITRICRVLLLLSACWVGAAARQPPSTSFSRASFVPPATPSCTRTGPLLFVPQPVQNSKTTTTAVGPLHAKKKKKAAPAASSKKIQVKLLQHVAGTGQAGQVIMVTPAFFNNKLRPTQLAELISDEEVKQEQAQAQAAQDALRRHATDLQSALASLDGGLVLARKAGPAGQLFGGIGIKAVLQELQTQLAPNHAYWDTEYAKSNKVKVVSLLGADNKKMRGDIKHTGEYSVSVALTPDLTVKVPIRVVDAADHS